MSGFIYTKLSGLESVFAPEEIKHSFSCVYAGSQHIYKRRSKCNEPLVFDSQNYFHYNKDFSGVQFPTATIYRLYRQLHHNRCIWKLCGKFVLAREVNICMKCKLCNAQVCVKNGSGRHKCNNKNNIVPSQVSSEFYIYWEGVFVFDDGTGEAHISLENKQLLSVLKTLFSPNYKLTESSDDRNNGNTLGKADHSCMSFHSFQESIETFVMQTFCSVSYSRAGIIKGRYYNSLRDSDFGVCSDHVGSPRPVQSSFLFRPKPCDKIFEGKSSHGSAKCTRNILFENEVHADMISAFLQSCSFASSNFEVAVKVIISKNSHHPEPGQGCGILSELISMKNLSNIVRKVKVQCSGVPIWCVENVEYPSKAIGTLKLQCVWERSFGRKYANISEDDMSMAASRAWKLMKLI